MHNKRTKRNTLVHIDRLKSALPVKKESTANIPKRLPSPIKDNASKKVKTMSDQEDFGEEFFLLTNNNVSQLLNNLRRANLRGEDEGRPRDREATSSSTETADDSSTSTGSSEEHQTGGTNRTRRGSPFQPDGTNSDLDHGPLLGHQRDHDQTGAIGRRGTTDKPVRTVHDRHAGFRKPISRSPHRESDASSTSASSYDTVPELDQSSDSSENDMEKEDSTVAKVPPDGAKPLSRAERKKNEAKSKAKKIHGPLKANLTRGKMKAMDLNLTNLPWNS